MKRQLTEAERELIAKRRPWLGAGRRDATDDLGANEAEIIAFSVRRFWDVNECGPPCCPRELLVETTAGEFIHLESWTVLPSTNEVGEDCAAHRTTASNTLLVFETTGSVIGVEQQSVRESLLDFEGRECERVKIADLPVEFQRVVGLSR